MKVKENSVIGSELDNSQAGRASDRRVVFGIGVSVAFVIILLLLLAPSSPLSVLRPVEEQVDMALAWEEVESVKEIYSAQGVNLADEDIEVAVVKGDGGDASVAVRVDEEKERLAQQASQQSLDDALFRLTSAGRTGVNSSEARNRVDTISDANSWIDNVDRGDVGGGYVDIAADMSWAHSEAAAGNGNGGYVDAEDTSSSIYVTPQQLISELNGQLAAIGRYLDRSSGYARDNHWAYDYIELLLSQRQTGYPSEVEPFPVNNRTPYKTYQDGLNGQAFFKLTNGTSNGSDPIYTPHVYDMTSESLYKRVFDTAAYAKRVDDDAVIFVDTEYVSPVSYVIELSNSSMEYKVDALVRTPQMDFVCTVLDGKLVVLDVV